MIEKKNNIWLVLLLLAGFALACSSLGGQNEEANKLVDEANVLNQKGNAHRTKSSELVLELLGDNLPKVKDIEAYKKVNRSKFDEAISESEQAAASMTEAADKFEQASKLEVDDKYKEYLGLVAQSTRKQIDAAKLVVATTKSFLETKDVSAINKLIENHNTKTAELGSEAEDLSAKADQVSKENPNVIGK